jgi:hypothetical protein
MPTLAEKMMACDSMTKRVINRPSLVEIQPSRSWPVIQEEPG